MRVHEFAELAGVTVKALHHYDRLGLLKPRRTEAGYRIYTERDLEHLEQIVALKFLGLGLRQIRTVLERGELGLVDALRMQRQVLEEKQRQLTRAIRAIEEAQRAIRPGEATDPAVLRKLIEVINMPDGFSEEAMSKFKDLYELMRSEEWRSLHRDFTAALGQEPTGEKAQALAARMKDLMDRDAGVLQAVADPETLASMKKAAGELPPELVKRFEESNVRKMVPFMMKALAGLGEKS
jgi:DNA-binding transcriptional MerR regulator